MTVLASMSRRAWVVAGVAEAGALSMAWFLWFFGVFAGPGFGCGDRAAVVALEVSAAVICLLVPGWLARRTRRRAWWLVGVFPGLFALGTGVVVLTGGGW